MRHRDGGPAYILADGRQAWFKDGMLHRDGDLPACVCSDGSLGWYVDDKRHRDIGPAQLTPPKFYEHGIERDIITIRGETMVARSPTSWSPVLCFI